MKKHLTGKTVIIAYFLISGIIAGCSKQVDIKPSLMNAQSIKTSQELDQLIRDTSSILHFLTAPFISQVNTTTRTDSTVLIFDFTLRKTFGNGEKNHLSIAYGDPQFVDRGWRYEITFDKKREKFWLHPILKWKPALFVVPFKPFLPLSINQLKLLNSLHVLKN